MRLLERADPARSDEGAPAIDAARYVESLRTTVSAVIPIEIDTMPTRRTIRRRWLLVAAAAAAAVMILVTVVQQRGPSPVRVEASTPTARAKYVASGFLQAFGAYDADRVLTYLSRDPDIFQLTGGSKGTPKELRLQLAWLHAGRYQQALYPCRKLRNLTSGTSLRCPFDFRFLRSDELGKGPFGGSDFDLTIRHGRIVRASLNFDTAEFSPQVWEPFATWVSTKHPRDAALMYTDKEHSMQRYTTRSIRLWQQRIREYVAEVKRTDGGGSP